MTDWDGVDVDRWLAKPRRRDSRFVDSVVALGVGAVALAGGALYGWIAYGDPTRVGIGFLFGYAVVTSYLSRRRPR